MSIFLKIFIFVLAIALNSVITYVVFFMPEYNNVKIVHSIGWLGWSLITGVLSFLFIEDFSKTRKNPKEHAIIHTSTH